jgi:hypothetical protein
MTKTTCKIKFKKRPFIGTMGEEKVDLISLQIDSIKTRTIILVQYLRTY